MTKKSCCFCFSYFSGRDTPSPSSPANVSSTYVDTNTTSPTVSAAQVKSIEPPFSSSSADQGDSSSDVIVKQDRVVPPPPQVVPPLFHHLLHVVPPPLPSKAPSCAVVRLTRQNFPSESSTLSSTFQVSHQHFNDLWNIMITRRKSNVFEIFAVNISIPTK
jgi:hypothetical protein